MADRGEYKREGDEEPEEEVDESDYKTQKDAIILAIEVSDSMLEPPPASGSKKADKDSPVQAALKCAYQLMQQRIISSPKDMMGILFFGTEKSKFHDEDGRGGLGYPHCYVFIDLDVPAANDVKALKSLVEGADAYEHDDDDEYEFLKPAKERVQMANVFFCANQIFTTKAANFGSRRLFVITDNDDPHPSDKSAKSAAAVRAKDLYDLGVTIELFPITQGDGSFDLSKFYDDIVYRDTGGEGNLTEVRSSKSGDGLTLLNSLISNINSKQTPKRALFSNLPLELAPGLRISVKGYNVLHRQTPARNCYVWLDGENPQMAIGETTRMAEDTARTIDTSEIKKAYKFGGEYVYFSPEEQKVVKDFGSPIIRMIGFKSGASIPFWASVKKSTFLFPSEEDYVGSTRVFTALWQKLVKSRKVGIAWCIVRTNANPVLCAVVPSRESSGEDNGTPYLPAGLWLCRLPFADDLRDGPAGGCDSAPVCASDDLVDKMRVIVQQLQLPKGTYDPTRYPNPALQWHYKILQALALEEEVPGKPDDSTEPKYRAIGKRAGGYLQEWDERLREETKTVLGTRKFKRELEDDDDGVESKPAKRTKTASAKPSTSGMTDAELRFAVASGSHNKMVVAGLKDLLVSRGLSSAGKKADLIERLEEWAEESI
ncbi:Ku DNA-binding complex, Ku70 subunit [Sodiomyces alkalinus F11]|uniref:ATP-dependent DNA helicase II subunit 1 n=1 Tax=Sodiomyces alkalinus (strain CBS 110278 / VKM F-3762 / F11) TaxID=1314773 RepID=A0A3N2Q4U9_SODAK|nr:Ku DNA-binding complex, Ku70 subunit [Sodiomyces alkalinus F11]ROT41803.1 Ku DNA-binding complex, Ku70 subunit [Sodiomyces alkalinus F11]